MSARVRVQEAPFDVGAELAGFAEDRRDVGAVVSFVGVVRGEGGALERMVIEHYPGMTEKAIGEIANEAARRWKLAEVLAIHRHGELVAGEDIMMVVAAARHRADAFAAAEFLMDFLKSRAPFWKKEFGPGGAAWVEAKEEDESALGRWNSDAWNARPAPGG